MRLVFTILFLFSASLLFGQLDVCENMPAVKVVTEEDVAKYCPEGVFIPSVFTPNGDGVNDVFQVISLVIFADFEMKIFNRWGQLLHRSIYPTNCWDGHLSNMEAPSGDYYWVISFTRTNGRREEAAGRVMLLR